MSNFTRYIVTILENLESEKRYLLDNDYEWIADKPMGNYILFLIKSAEGEYEVGITSFDRGFTTFDDQQKSKPKDSLHKHIEIIKQTLTQWIKQYGTLFVGSFNKERTFLYHRVFSKMFNCSPVEHADAMHGLPESWNFTINI